MRARTLVLLLATSLLGAYALACDTPPGKAANGEDADCLCGTGTWAVYRPEAQYKEGPNLTAGPISYTTVGEPCAVDANA